MSGPKVLAVVLNWQQPQATLDCVAALKAMNPPLPEILVVDNGSEDNSAETLLANLDPAALILLPENLGFAGGMNAGLRSALDNDFEFVLLMNNDTIPAPDMLTRLLAAVEPGTGLYSPVIFYESDRQRIWFAGGRRHPALLELRDRGTGKLYTPAAWPTREVDYLLGTCLLADMSAVKKVGLLDERYFMYYEDLDWSIRFQQHHYRLRVVGDAHLYHQVALSSGGSAAPARRYYLARSSILFFHRHGRLGKPWLIFLFRLGSALKMVARLVMNGRLDSARAYLRGLRHGLRDTRKTNIDKLDGAE